MTETKSPNRTGVPYRSRSGMVLGVCKGLATHLDFPLFWMRFFAILAMFFTGLWPLVGLYFLAALVMKPEPVIPFRTTTDEEFYNSYTSSRRTAIQRIRRTYEELDRRLQRLETRVTDREFDWHARLNA